MEAWVKGVNPKGNSTNPSNWDFGSSFFFAGTVVTTIGKGSGEEGLPCLGWVPQKQMLRQGCGFSRRRLQEAPVEEWESDSEDRE